ncbi:mannitol dehydrogenase family protein [Fluviibacterium sp. DFM31]|uniref:Mannitol dehydrogenase family protein n=1 Tax=Meridianimarinicoccus marinus TaxID=3231483 RepID=A0ABV3LBH9_9RHOB
MIRSPLPSTLGVGILHLGLGAFHRAHQAAFTQDAIAEAGGDWGIEAVSMRNPALAELLNRQNGTYSLIERRPEGPRILEMTVIRKARALPGRVQEVASRMADPAIRIVTVTVTEKGYGASAERRLNLSDPGVAHDLLAPDEPPQSLAGLITAGLAKRRTAGLGGLTVMSCDNLPENGRLLGALVSEFAEEADPSLARWIADTCRFPNSMVDRITPAATDKTFELVESEVGKVDRAAIETEPFRQWVIEDDFAGPRPAWEEAGALIVPDVAAFETMKLRLLNGSHSLIAYLGALSGYPAVRDVVGDAGRRAVVRRHMADSAETLYSAPGLDPDAYADALITRFANPAIDHRCLQIAMDGSQKLPQRIFAPARTQLDTERGIGTFALATAAWIKFAGGRDDNGRGIDLNDPLADNIRRALAASEDSPAARVAAIAGLAGLAHHGVLDNARFLRATVELLSLLDRVGARAAAAVALNSMD